MANKKISELQSRTPALSDLMLVGDPSSGYSYKCTVTALATIIETDIADGYVTIGTTQTISGAKTFSNNLTLTSVVNTPTDPDKFLTLNASNVVTYRTGSQVLSDIGAADDTLVVHKAGTETITGFKTFQSRLSIDGSLNLLQGAGANTDAGYSSINADSGGFFIRRATGIHAYLNLANLTTARNFTFPDVTGTIALTSDITDALTGYVPTSRTLTINGVTQSLAANRTFNVGTVETVNFTTGTTGTDVNVSGSPITTTGTITLNIPTASATNRGALSSTDWSTFNNKQSAISLTTTGNSGAATFVSNTLNIPNYTLAGLGGISGSGTTNYIPKFTSSSAIGNSQIQDDGTNVGVGGSPSSQKLRIYGGTIISNNNFYYGFNSGGSQATIVGISSGDNITLGQNNVNHSNTIIYGGTGNIEFSTGGSERMRLTSGGLLGLGTSSPSRTLSIGGAANAYMDFKSSSNRTYTIGSDSNGFIVFDDNASAYRMVINASGNLGLGTSSPTSFSGYTTLSINNATNGAILNLLVNGTETGRFQAYANTLVLAAKGATSNMLFETNGSERMRLDASGNLGLGVTPSAWGSGYTAFQTRGTTIGSNSTSGTYYTQNAYYDGTNWVYVSTSAANRYQMLSGVHSWHTAASGTAGTAISFTQAMTLDASGRLGIGITSPSAFSILDANGQIRVSNLSVQGFYQARTSDVAGSGVFGGNSFVLRNGATSEDLNFDIFNRSTSAWYTPMIIKNSTGNVGIGTASPNSILQIKGAFNIERSNTTDYSIIDNEGNLNIKAATGGGGGSFNTVFFTGGSERMRITSGGELLINTTSDAGDYKLQVNGNIYGTGDQRLEGALYLTNGGGGPAQIYGSNTDGVLRIRNNNIYVPVIKLMKSDGTTMLNIDDGNISMTGSIKTAAPSGGTAKPWKLGQAGVTLGGSNTSGIAVEIDGTTYYLVTGYLP